MKSVAITSKNSFIRSSDSNSGADLDTPLLLLLFLFYGLGLVQVYSSSFIFATETRNDGLFFFKRQLVFTFLSIITLIVFSKLNMQFVRKLVPYAWGVAFLGAIVAMHPSVGHSAGGASRWIDLGVFKFEPSELLKVLFPIIFADFATRDIHKEYLKDKIIKMFVLAAPLPVLLLQPDFGSTVVISLVAFSLFFMLGLKWRYILTAAALAMPAFYFLVMSVPYRKARLLAFLDPWSDPSKTGFQVIQSLLSFSSGGFTGQGLGGGQGKLFFLPEAHTDFTLAVLGEEAGFVGFSLILLLYFIIIFRGFAIGINVRDSFAKISAIGLIVLFSIQVVTNICVVLGLLPTKGLTLPFLSYGGSSLVVLGMLFGILMNIERTYLRQKS